jgi:hypothetical protein
VALTSYTTPDWMLRLIQVTAPESRPAVLRGANPAMADLVERLNAGGSLAGVSAATAVEAVSHLDDAAVLERLLGRERRRTVRDRLNHQIYGLERRANAAQAQAATPAERTAALLTETPGTGNWQRKLADVAARPESYDLEALAVAYAACEDPSARSQMASHLFDVFGPELRAQIIEELADGSITLSGGKVFHLVVQMWPAGRALNGHLCRWLTTAGSRLPTHARAFLAAHGVTEGGVEALLDAQAPYVWLFDAGLDAAAVRDIAVSGSPARCLDLLQSCSPAQLDVIAPALVDAHMPRGVGPWRHFAAPQVAADGIAGPTRFALLRVCGSGVVAEAMTGGLAAWRDAPVDEIAGGLAEGRFVASGAEVLSSLAFSEPSTGSRAAAAALIERCPGLVRSPKWLSSWAGKDLMSMLTEAIGDSPVGWALVFQMIPTFNGTAPDLVAAVRGAIGSPSGK